jgi:hypothetical protein
MGSAARGNAAEAAVLNGLIDLGFEVLVPFGSGHPFDLAIYGPACGFLRIQCKRAWPVKGCLTFNSRTTDHGRGQQSYLGLADLFGVYFPPTDSVFLIPVEEIPGFAGRLRLEPTRNNQRKGIRLAADFEIRTWTDERLAGLTAAARGPAA